jgi:hypothetical protein
MKLCRDKLISLSVHVLRVIVENVLTVALVEERLTRHTDQQREPETFEGETSVGPLCHFVEDPCFTSESLSK